MANSQPAQSKREPCGRIMVGSGTDTYDPICELPEGHEGACKSRAAIDQHRLVDEPLGSDRCRTCGVSKQQVLGKHEEVRAALEAMTAARDYCKRQTADVEELRQWQANHARVALQAIEAHGNSGVWSAEDCATQATAALERMRSPVDSVSDGMRDA